MTEPMNELALAASQNEAKREALLSACEKTILRTASRVSRRFITRSDDEWSVALCAFFRAVDLYSESRGSFMPFAQMLIKRAIIDYHRGQSGALREVSVAPHVLEGNGTPEEDTEGAYRAVVRDSMRLSDTSLREEILTVNQVLSDFGFHFFDLTECSPRQEKTKRECAAAIRYVLDQPLLLRDLMQSGKLSVKAVSEGSGVSKKTVDRYRKYLIMATIVLHGEYPHLKEYLKFVQKEGRA